MERCWFGDCLKERNAEAISGTCFPPALASPGTDLGLGDGVNEASIQWNPVSNFASGASHAHNNALWRCRLRLPRASAGLGQHDSSLHAYPTGSSLVIIHFLHCDRSWPSSLLDLHVTRCGSFDFTGPSCSSQIAFLLEPVRLFGF